MTEDTSGFRESNYYSVLNQVFSWY